MRQDCGPFHDLVDSFDNKHWLGTYDVPSTAPGTGDTAKTKTNSFYLVELTI